MGHCGRTASAAEELGGLDFLFLGIAKPPPPGSLGKNSAPRIELLW